MNSAFGLYVSSVDNELPVPSPPYPGWMVRVNGVMPSVGADQVALHSGDSVLWYYGTYDASPTVAALPASHGDRRLLGGGDRQAARRGRRRDAAGRRHGVRGLAHGHLGRRRPRLFPATRIGDFAVRVTKDGYIRSALTTVRVRYASSLTVAPSKTAVTKGGLVQFTGALASPGRVPPAARSG